MQAKPFNKIYKLLTVAATICIINPIVYLLFYHLIPKGLSPILLLLSAVFVGAGYGMQALYGTITSPRHDARRAYYDEDGYEGADKPFQPLRAALPLTVAAVLAISSFGIINAILFALYRADVIMTYNSQSVYPLIGAAFVFLYMFAGIVLWFYPAHRIISHRMVLPYFAVMGVIFALSVMLSVPTTMLSISFVVFFACEFIVLNQTYIQKGVMGTVTAISGEGRLYNFKLTIVAMIAVVVILFVCAVILTGVGFFLRFALAYLAHLYSWGGSGTDDKYFDVGEAEAGFSEVLLKNQPVGDKLMVVLCILLFVGAIIFFIFRGHAATKRMIELIKLWLRELFLFFMSLKEFGGMSKEKYFEYTNYQDEQISLQDATIRSYDPKIAQRRSYREFLAYLNSLDTATEQIRYAYMTMLSVYHSLGYGIRKSETPRETERRIRSRSTDSGMTEVRAAVESIDYIEVEPPSEDCERALRAMCRVMEKHFTS